LGRLKQSFECAEKALKLDDKLALAWSNKGLVLLNMGRHYESLNCSERALKIEPKLAIAWNNKAAALLTLGKFKEALECAERALNIDATLSLAWLNKAASFNNLDKSEEALSACNKAIELGLNDFKVWTSKAIALENLGRHFEAIECAEKAIEMNSYDHFAWTFKGIAKGRLGKHKEALECFEKALEVDPNFEMAKDNKRVAERKVEEIERIEREQEKLLKKDIVNAYVLGNIKKVLKLSDKIIKLNDTSPYAAAAWLNKGNIFYDEEQFEKALECYEKAFDLESDSFSFDAETLANKAEILREFERKEEALECYEKAIEIDENNFRAWMGKFNCTLPPKEEVLTNPEEALEKINESLYCAKMGRRFCEHEELVEHIEKIILSTLDLKMSICESLGMYEDVIECADEISEKKRGDKEDLMAKARALIQLEEHGKALKIVEELIEKEPKNSRLWGMRGLCLFTSGKYDMAFYSTERAKELCNDPEFIKVLQKQEEIIFEKIHEDEEYEEKGSIEVITHEKKEKRKETIRDTLTIPYQTEMVRVAECFRVLQRIKEMTEGEHSVNEYEEQVHVLGAYAGALSEKFVSNVEQSIGYMKASLNPDETTPKEFKEKVGRACKNAVDLLIADFLGRGSKN
jgi:tetratricopeptide (TPR) repeat protein